MDSQTIILIIKYFPPLDRISGISSFFKDLVDTLCQTGFKVVVISSLSKEGINLKRKEYVHNNFSIYRVKFPFPITSALTANRIADFKDSIIIVSGIYQYLRQMLYFGLIKIVLKKIPFFWQATNMERGNLFSNPAKAWLEKSFIKVIVSNPQTYFKLPVGGQFIPPGVDLNRLEKFRTNKNDYGKRPVRIGFFGHFKSKKGADLILDAYQKIPNKSDYQLILAGEGNDLDEKIKQFARQYRNISVFNHLANIYQTIASCDFVVLPYRTSASVLGIARTGQEALALGVPLIVTRSRAVEILVESGYNGYVVDASREIFSIIDKVSPKKYSELSIHAVESSKSWDINLVANKFIEVINKHEKKFN